MIRAADGGLEPGRQERGSIQDPAQATIAKAAATGPICSDAQGRVRYRPARAQARPSPVIPHVGMLGVKPLVHGPGDDRQRQRWIAKLRTPASRKMVVA